MKKILLLAVLASTSISMPANSQSQLGGKPLPPTTMDSFVKQAQGNADLIYGDEGTLDIPPYDSFDKIHRINSGIYDRRARGLTTNHSSYLPDAWGGDEWTGNEWDRSGSGSNQNPPIYIPGQSTFGPGGLPYGNPNQVLPPFNGGPSVNLQVGPVDVQVGGNMPGAQGVTLQAPRLPVSPIPLTGGHSIFP